MANTLQHPIDLYTHAGPFHADEVWATVMLKHLYYGQTCVHRIKDAQVKSLPHNDNTIVYDIGGGKYDHHQEKAPADSHNDGIPRASFGLLWLDYGYKVVQKELYLMNQVWPDNQINSIVTDLDNTIIKEIDAYDSGFLRNNGYSISQLVGTAKTFDEAFNLIAPLWKTILHHAIIAEMHHSQVINQMELLSPAVAYLHAADDWQFLNERYPELKFVIYESTRGGYNLVGVPINTGSFYVRQPLPVNLIDNPNVTFVHKNKFLANIKTLSAAKKIAFDLTPDLTKKG